MKCITLARVDGASEGATKNDFASGKGHFVQCEFIGEPGDAVGWMIEHGGGDAGFFDRAIAPTDGGDPTEVGIKRFEWTAAYDECGVGCVIGDGVEDFASDFGFGIDLMDAGVDNFDGGDDVIGGVEDVEDGAIGTL